MSNLLILALYILPVILLTFYVETESFGWATVLFLASAISFGFVHKTELISFVQTHWIQAITFTGLYLILGVVWTFIRWFVTLVQYNETFKNARHQFLLEEKLDVNEPIPTNKMNDFISWCRHYKINLHFQFGMYNGKRCGIDKVLRLQAKDNKSKIIAWGCFWPVSIMGFVLNDPVRRLFTLTFNTFSNSYQWLSNKIINHAEFNDRE